MSSGKSPSCHLTDTGLIASWVNEPLDPTKCNCRHKIVVRTSTTRRLYSSIEAQAWAVDPIGSRHSPDWLAHLESADNSRRGFLRASKRPCWKCQSQSAGVRAFGRHYLVFLMIGFRARPVTFPASLLLQPAPTFRVIFSALAAKRPRFVLGQSRNAVYFLLPP